MRTEYKIRKYEDVVQIIALVSPYGFYPEGDLSDWITYAESVTKENSYNKVELYMESQDKETGYCSERLIHRINK